jgi:hypothetical protein
MSSTPGAALAAVALVPGVVLSSRHQVQSNGGAAKLDGEPRHDSVVRQLRLADRQLGIDLQ